MTTSPADSGATAECQRAVEWLCRLCAADTTTGQEDRGLPPLLEILEALGAHVRSFPVAEGRSNVLATWGQPCVLLTTHLDTVPPYIAPEHRDGAVWGRGACDAKGQAISQLGAIRRLLESGEQRVAWLGVVGEETVSDGAEAAVAELASELTACRAVINGEPTRLRLATGQRGILHVRLRCRGRAAHSALEHLGEHAIWPLVDWVRNLRSQPLAEDPDLGRESWNLARFRGGEALNDVPAEAEAELLARTVKGSTLLDGIRATMPECGSVEVVHDEPPCTFPAIDDFERQPMPYGSDAPRLRSLARDGLVAMIGPGSIDVAHTVEEHLREEDLMEGIEVIERLVRVLLPEAPGT